MFDLDNGFVAFLHAEANGVSGLLPSRFEFALSVARGHLFLCTLWVNSMRKALHIGHCTGRASLKGETGSCN